MEMIKIKDGAMGEKVIEEEAILNARLLVRELEGYEIVGAVLTREKQAWGFRAEKKIEGKVHRKTVWVMRDEEATGMGVLHYMDED